MIIIIIIIIIMIIKVFTYTIPRAAHDFVSFIEGLCGFHIQKEIIIFSALRPRNDQPHNFWRILFYDQISKTSKIILQNFRPSHPLSHMFTWIHS